MTHELEPIANTKQHRILVKFPATPTQPEVQVKIEMFQIITIEITRKEKGYKLNGKLLRPDR